MSETCQIRGSLSAIRGGGGGGLLCAHHELRKKKCEGAVHKSVIFPRRSRTCNSSWVCLRTPFGEDNNVGAARK